MAVPGARLGAARLKRAVRRVSRCAGVGAAWRALFFAVLFEGAPSGLGAGLVITSVTRCYIRKS
jgi:hypothetical protein